jgi:tRNA threonylcarbamoyladenosine biosynthesis protein TsaE
MAEPVTLTFRDAAATEEGGCRLARAVQAAGTRTLTVYLEGELGAGKTTFVRGFLAGLGHGDRVPSPTYTLIEPYDLDPFRVQHLDLYRIRDPAELDDLGLEDMLIGNVIALVEWPDHGRGHLPAPDLRLRFEWLPAGRRLDVIASTDTGCHLAAALGLQAASDA